MNVKHIGIFGRRNVGKSSIINLLLGQDFAIVSPKAGTTTDPVKKRMEIPGVGPVQLIDTAGIDDEGVLGEMRVGKSLKLTQEVDLALLVFSGNIFGKQEKELLSKFKESEIPVVIVHNQSDIIPLDTGVAGDLNNIYNCDVVEFSCCLMDEQEQRDAVEMLISFITKGLILSSGERTIMQGMVEEGDNFVLVCPIDSEAPQGRLILPQVMTIRDILDNGGVATVLQPEQLRRFFANRDAAEKDGYPYGIKMVITDSQVFKKVSEIVPDNVSLTSFSVLMARAKGPYEEYLKGVEKISQLKAEDKILVLESCTHHTSCEDIGRVKIPALLKKSIGGGELNFTFVSGLDELPPLGDFALVLQCGGCMVTRRQLCNRIKKVIEAGVPVTNYGMAIAYLTGIFDRVTKGIK